MRRDVMSDVWCASVRVEEREREEKNTKKKAFRSQQAAEETVGFPSFFSSHTISIFNSLL